MSSLPQLVFASDNDRLQVFCKTAPFACSVFVKSSHPKLSPAFAGYSFPPFPRPASSRGKSMPPSNRSFLKQVVQRDIRTFFSISEMLECGHSFESLTLLADPLTAKHRVCPKCAQAAALPPKKPVTSVPRIPAWRKKAVANDDPRPLPSARES